MHKPFKLPEWGGKSRAGREVSQLRANAAQEQASQAVAVDHWQAGWCKPADEAKADDGKILPQPVPLEAAQVKRIEVISQRSINEMRYYSRYIRSTKYDTTRKPY